MQGLWSQVLRIRPYEFGKQAIACVRSVGTLLCCLDVGIAFSEHHIGWELRGKVCVWDVDSGRVCAELFQLGEKLGVASMSANGDALGAFDNWGRLRLWRLAGIDQ